MQEKYLRLISLLLTAIVAISTCFATYFAYQSVKITSDAEFREKLRLIMDAIETLENISDKTSTE